MIKQYKV